MILYLKICRKKNVRFRYFFLFAFIAVGFTLVACYSSAGVIPVSRSTITALAKAPDLQLVTPPPANTYDFEVLISELETTMPGPHTDGFQVPDKSDEQAFKPIIVSLLNNDPTTAASRADILHYELLSLFDQADSEAESYVLKEQQPIEKGWGLFFIRKHNPQNIVIEAPHPIADQGTEKAALHLYRALQAKTLLIAGTHRDANDDGSSDLTHSPDSIFQTVHMALFNLNGQPNTKTIFLQIHGFATELHPKAAQVVLGYNWKNDPEKDALLAKIVDSLESNGISVDTCNDHNYQGLCGASNVQRLATQGGIFIHMELNRVIRSDDSSFVSSLQKALIP